MEATVEELKQRETDGKNDYVLLDVREDYERAEFNVGGIHVPLGQLSMSMDKLTPYRDQEIIVYCRSGKRSAMAQELLRQCGFKNVRNLEGGMLAYQG
ncbi:rhodanese-like domain-containing protein [Lewinella sp. JB7]|uniref:rhodanese-like domain-containing protein n=1 Tax=Lewinella sp. JB7 TaxID=2962887 RepID=UPI0020C9DE35|nr:rhodanese-like domain-containing protein [Lewinella sp. JB7]MCP9236917.1 rhodanese-like domain-containing protein [Lewinella sp. JB7]